jgi:hypothetical protein
MAKAINHRVGQVQMLESRDLRDAHNEAAEVCTVPSQAEEGQLSKGSEAAHGSIIALTTAVKVQSPQLCVLCERSRACKRPTQGSRPREVEARQRREL